MSAQKYAMTFLSILGNSCLECIFGVLHLKAKVAIQTNLYNINTAFTQNGKNRILYEFIKLKNMIICFIAPVYFALLNVRNVLSYHPCLEHVKNRP